MRRLLPGCRARAPLPPGIYVNDIIEAVPIDKYFELFKPSAGGEGGFVRLSLDYSKDASQLPGAKGSCWAGEGTGGNRARGGGGAWREGVMG